MRRSLILLAGIALIAACESRAPAPPAAPERDRFDVALLTSGSIADDGWNAAAYEGVRRIQRDLGAAALHREVRGPSAMHEAMRSLARGGIDVVFAQGEEFQDAAHSAGPHFEKTVFVVAEGDRRAPNLVPLVLRVEEAAWILGMAAGSESKSGRGGALGVARSRAAARAFAAFRAGAQSIRPGFVLDEEYVPRGDAPEAGRRAALALIDGGADVLFEMGGEAGSGAIAACAERGILCFGGPRKLNDRAPETIVGSAVADLPAAMTEIAALVKDRRFRSRLFSYGMKEGMVTVAWNEDLRRRIPADVMRRIDETQTAILDGRFRPLAVAR